MFPHNWWVKHASYNEHLTVKLFLDKQGDKTVWWNEKLSSIQMQMLMIIKTKQKG